MPQMTCAVVIATRNRPDWLRQTLKGLVGSVAKRILVVDQSDETFRSQTCAVAQGLADVHYIDAPCNGLPAARNLGLSVIKEDIVIFFDDDVHVYPGCIAAHLAAYDDPKVGAVVGRIVEARVAPNRPDVGNSMARSGRMKTRLSGTKAQYVQSVKGANMSFRSEVLIHIGGFDEGYLGTAYLEEVDVSERIGRDGWRIRFEPLAEVVHFSAPQGGARVSSKEKTEMWRFHNTGYFLAKNRGFSEAGLGHLTFSAVAVKRGLQWRDPRVAGRLMSAMVTGWLAGR
jgi:glycogen(starch) synthase